MHELLILNLFSLILFLVLYLQGALETANVQNKLCYNSKKTF